MSEKSSVRAKIRLYNGSKLLRDVELPSTLFTLACIVETISAVEMLNDRVNVDLHEPQMAFLLAAAKEQTDAVRSKNPVVLNAVKEWMHSLYAIRKYKVNSVLNAGGGDRGVKATEHVRITLEAWPLEA